MTPTWTLSTFLEHLRTLDVRLALDGERLTVSAPKGALTDDIKSELQKRKPEILAFLKSAATSQPGQAPPLVPIDRSAGAPLSYSQQRLWFLDRMAPGNPIYNISGAIRMRGALDRNALEQSLKLIVQRHDSLRTVFQERGGMPKAIVQPFENWHVQVSSLLHLPENERENEVRRLAGIESRRPFDLSHDALIRATLLTVSEQEHVLVLVMHHIVSDGWSLGVFVRDLSQAYPIFLQGKTPQLAPLQIHYGDYADWNRRWLESGAMASQLPYWKESLAGPLPVLDLPLDHPRPAIQTYNGHRSECSISVELTEKIKQLSRAENGTLFMTLLAAYQILLHRYTGQHDVIVGTAVANRDRPELADLIGFFVNNLVLRTDLSGNPTVRECISRVRQVSLEGSAHQEVPFDRLVEVLRPERSLNRSPLFQTMFILQNWPLKDLELPSVTVSLFEFDAGLARYDLSIEAVERANALWFNFEFNTDLFDAASIARMQQHYKMLLSRMVENPDQRIDELGLMTTDETKNMLVAWNDTTVPFSDTQCVHELIDAQAERTPDAEAVRFGETSLTYRDLIQRANQLAHRLRAMGVGPDTLVGISLERSHEMVVALLGVWKAGGAYVPLDPSYPRERLAFMAEDAGLVALITEEPLLAIIPEPRCPVLFLDRAAIAAEPTSPPTVAASPRQLAYVIYTSGSTGKPKGVLLEHRSVVNFLQSMKKTPGMQSSDTLLSVTTLSFDIAGLEIYLPLVSGARVVLASRATASDGMLLMRAIKDSGATVMQATPATWRLLLESGWHDATGLKIFCGGEALPRQLADALLATGAELWNLYGPTETTIWSTMARVGPDGDPIPIGRPIVNTEIYILDQHLAPVPANVAGELYIGGAGLARGYLNRPELTAERFVANPFIPGTRMYRTGDQARYRPDGTIEYLGRLDHQVKVRGFRIELGEIEAVISTHDRVQQAVVMAREDVPGDQRLVAYLVSTPGEPFVGAPMRAWLTERLPQFMIPSVYVLLDRLPLTPNGKVDRRALPAPQDAGQGAPVASFVSPKSGVESAVAEIWREILRVDRVGVDDNFFDLGGHSLLVVQLQSKLRERFSKELSLMELFRRPTVGAIAEYLE